MVRNKTQIDLAPGGGWRLRVADLPLIKQSGNQKTYRVDLAGAPRPARRYVADVAWFRRRPDQSVIYFGQLRLDDKLRSVVAVAVSPQTAGKIVRESKDSTQTAISILERTKVEPLPAAPISEEPDQAVLLRASMMSVAVAEMETVLDFFHVSPAEARDMHRTGYLDIDPIVRIELSTALLVGLMNEMYAHEGYFPKEDA